MRLTIRLPRALWTTLVTLGLGVLGGRAGAAQDLQVFRGPEGEDGRFSLFVTGALPRQVVELRAFLGHPPEDARLAYTTAGQQLGRVRTDAAGHARLIMDSSLLDDGPRMERPFVTVQAFGRSSERGLSWSNVCMFETLPVLYLLVESPPGSPVPHRVLCFDPVGGRLEEVGRGLARHGASTVRHHANQSFEVGPDQTLFFSDPTDSTRLCNTRTPQQDAVLGPGERILDMVASRDDSALVLMTALALPQDRVRVRLRMLDLTTSQPRWITEVPLLRAELPADAWLVADAQRPLVYVASRSPGRDKIRAVTVGGSLVPGPWLPPSPTPSRDSLVDVQVAGDLLVALSESREDAVGRVVVMATPSLVPDSRALDSLEAQFPGRPVACAVQARGPRGRVFVLTGSGGLHSFTVDLAAQELRQEEPPAVQGALEIAVSPVPGEVLVLVEERAGERRAVRVLNAETGEVRTLAGSSLDSSVHSLQVLEHGGELWLTMVEGHPDPAVAETLVVWRLSPDGRAALESQRIPLGGTVTRLRRR